MSLSLAWLLFVLHFSFALMSIVPTLFDADALQAANSRGGCYENVSLGKTPNVFADTTALDTYSASSTNAAWLEDYDDNDSHYVRVGNSSFYRRVGSAWVAVTEGSRVKRWHNVPAWFCATPLASFINAVDTLLSSVSINPIKVVTGIITGAAEMVKAILDLMMMDYAILRHEGEVLGTVSIIIRIGAMLLTTVATLNLWFKKG